MIRKWILLASGIAATALTACGGAAQAPETTTIAQETTTTTQETTTTTQETTVKEADMLVVDNNDMKITFKGVGKSEDSMIELIFEVENKKTDGAMLEFMLGDLWYNGVQYGTSNGIGLYEPVIEGKTQEIRLGVYGDMYKIDKVADINDVKFIITASKDMQVLYKSELTEYTFN